jgi:8-oxo-dGTP pyrophosphatase MutT (NUDIX family)
VDDGDADAPAAALREAREEIGLDPGNVDLLANSDP